MSRRLLVIPSALVGLSLLAGCGGSAAKAASIPPATTSPAPPTLAPAVTSTTVDLTALGRRYLAIVAPMNAAATALNDASAKAKPTDLGAPLVAPFVAALQTADIALLRVAWPPTVAVDVKAMVAMHGEVIGEMAAIDSQTALSSASYTTQLGTDISKAAAAAQVVRADLGLPPA